MLLLALIVGGVTAWFVGARIGLYAAIASAVALLVATIVPGTWTIVYGVIGLWLVGVWLFKAKLAVLFQPKQPEKKGWEREFDRWKARAAWLLKSRK